MKLAISLRLKPGRSRVREKTKAQVQVTGETSAKVRDENAGTAEEQRVHLRQSTHRLRSETKRHQRNLSLFNTR